MGMTRQEREAVHATIPEADLQQFKRDLDKLDKKTWRSYYRKATRRSQKTHILPFLRKATPDGSGKKGYGRKSMAQSGLRQAGGTRLSAGTYMSRRSTGRLRRDFKVKAMKRSRTLTGNSSVNFQKSVWYGKLLEKGRTWNLFKKMSEWRKVPSSRKGPNGDLWKPGRFMWLNATNRRRVIAERAVVRYVSEWIKKDDKANQQQIIVK